MGGWLPKLLLPALWIGLGPWSRQTLSNPAENGRVQWAVMDAGRTTVMAGPPWAVSGA